MKTVLARDLDIGMRLPDLYGGATAISHIRHTSAAGHVIVCLADGTERVFRSLSKIEVAS